MITMGPTPEPLPAVRHAAMMKIRPVRPASQRACLLAACGMAAVASALLPIAAQAQNALGASGLGGNGYGASGIGLGSGLQPATALGGNLANLRALVDSPVLETASDPYSYFASIGAFAGYTDNVSLSGYGGGGTGTSRGSSFERLTPSIGGAINLTRLTASANYAPSLSFFNNDSKANSISQNLSAQATAVLVEDTLFVSASAYATQASTSQLSSFNGNNNTVNTGSTQVYSYSVSPYVTHQFGDIGTLSAGYSLSESYFQNGAQNNVSTIPLAYTQNQKNNNTVQQGEHANFSTGSYFNRFNHSLSVSAEQFMDSNGTQNGHSNAATYTLSYALNRFFTLIGQVGYENLYYAPTFSNGAQTSQRYQVSGMTGQGGFKFTPNEDSSITASYGHHDGGNSASVNGVLRPTARITLLANTSSGVTTNGQDLASFASSANFGSDGVARDGGSGAPLLYSLGALGISRAPYRATRASASAIYGLDRDTWAVSFTYSKQQGVSSLTTATTSTGASTSQFASLSWQHEISEQTRMSATVNYGTQTNGATTVANGGSHPVVGANAQLVRILSEQLTAELDYIYTSQQLYVGTANHSSNQSMNEILIGLTQKF